MRKGDERLNEYHGSDSRCFLLFLVALGPGIMWERCD